MKTIFLAIAVALSLISNAQVQTTNVSLLNNTYVDGRNNANGDYDVHNGVRITKQGLVMSKDASTFATSYVYFTKGQSPEIALLAKGKGKVSVNVGGKKKTITVNSNELKEYKLGTYQTAVDGYLRLRYQLAAKGGEVTIKDIVVRNQEKPLFLSEDFNTHFGLRGPSCHLGYRTEAFGEEFEWALLSITVPHEWDKIGSYYMALGFDCGYFGFQNNSDDRRIVLFSVWNSVESDDPHAVAEAHATKVIAKGEGVTAQNFGNEGSGKQSFINVGWKTDQTYTFLLHAEKPSATSTDFSAWFYDSEKKSWQYMATLRRPDTKQKIKGIHSFLENFVPYQGDKTRKAFYHNVWVKPEGGDWKYVTQARLTNDVTGSKGIRLDFNGGASGNRFYLTNGGYFDRSREIDRKVELEDTKTPDYPTLDLSKFVHP